MKIIIQTLLVIASISIIKLTAVEAATSEEYPNGPIKLIVPLAAGGPSDEAARMLAEYLTTQWKNPVVVENKPGANGLIGAMEVSKAKPDGHTLLFAVPSLATFNAFLKSPPVDVHRDLEAVSLIVDKGYYLQVNSQVPVSTAEELIAYAKQHPGDLNFGAFAGGALLAAEMFNQMAGINIVRVQYRGEAPAALALASNQTQVHLGSLVATKGYVDSGKVKVLATTTKQRLPTMPDLPTLDEGALPGYEARVWYGLMAPKGTPLSIRKQLANEIERFVKDPIIAKRFKDLEYIPRSTDPDKFRLLLDQEIAVWTDVARRADIKKQ